MKERGIFNKYTTGGFIAGIFFPLIFMLTETLKSSQSFQFQTFIQLHDAYPVLYFLDLLPFLFAYLAYRINKRITKLKRETLIAREKQNTKNKNILEFTESIASGNFESEYTIDSSDKDDDHIGHSLLKLREYLRKNRQEEEKRRKTEQQQNWTTEGLAKFGDILRKNNDNIQELSYNILSNLVNYVDARQGGFFLINDNNPEDKHFELTACYAYNRKKFLQKRIELEEGLVGACALEKQTIFITDVPREHVTITSGLGETKPNCLILIPLKLNEEVHGVIELASLKEFEKFEIDFLEKLAESIASVISSVKINLQTAKLLKESQEQSKILASQEDEMRRNMEELSYAKEEAAKQGELLANFTNAVNHTLVRAEYNTDGVLIYANTRFLNKLGYNSSQEIVGKHISIFINEKDRDWFFKIWDTLSKGGKHFEGDMKHVTKQGKDFWSMATYTCVRNDDGSIDKILFLGIDITEQKKQNLDYESQIDALNKNNLKIEFNLEGNILEANPKFHELSEIHPDNIHKYSVFSFVEEENKSKFKTIWSNILKGIPFETDFKLKTQSGKEKWIQGSYNAVRDMYGEVSKIIYLASDITQKKQVELENERQNKLLKQQEEQLLKQQEEIKKQHQEFIEKTEQNIKEIQSVKVRNEKTLEGALDAIVTINQEEKIELFNKAAEQLWGIPRHRVLGKSVKLILPKPYDTLKDGKVFQFLQSDQNHLKGNRTEVNIENNAGEKIPVLLTLTEVKIGNEYTYTAFIQNISVELF
ncbi:MAG: PAS domain S-box protein [Bacteroidota bacterium]